MGILWGSPLKLNSAALEWKASHFSEWWLTRRTTCSTTGPGHSVCIRVYVKRQRQEDKDGVAGVVAGWAILVWSHAIINFLATLAQSAWHPEHDYLSAHT